jgi:hypothetical protein
VFGLGFGGLEGTGQQQQLGVLELFHHLGVRNVFVEHYACH